MTRRPSRPSPTRSTWSPSTTSMCLPRSSRRSSATVAPPCVPALRPSSTPRTSWSCASASPRWAIPARAGGGSVPRKSSPPRSAMPGAASWSRPRAADTTPMGCGSSTMPLRSRTGSRSTATSSPRSSCPSPGSSPPRWPAGPGERPSPIPSCTRSRRTGSATRSWRPPPASSQQTRSASRLSPSRSPRTSTWWACSRSSCSRRRTARSASTSSPCAPTTPGTGPWTAR